MSTLVVNPDTARVETAAMIPGWMGVDELLWLAEAATRSKCIAELGSWRGRSTRALADNTPGHVFAVDNWQDSQIGYPAWWTEKDPKGLYERKDWLWDSFRESLGDLLWRKVIPVRMLTLEAASWARQRMLTFDMIFIDAGHFYEYVREDIVAWRPLLKPGGIFCGHDYNHPDCPGVARAVGELLPNVANPVSSIWCEI